MEILRAVILSWLVVVHHHTSSECFQPHYSVSITLTYDHIFVFGVVVAPRTSLAGLQSTVTALPCTEYM